MADDELFSLDFTVPSAAPPVPPMVAEPEVVPVPAAQETATLPPALVEAAKRHALGDFLGASRLLEPTLKNQSALGEYADLAWQAMFEVLQDLNRRDAFDKLALMYARHLEKSPPPWLATEITDHHDAVADASVSLPATLSADIGPLLKALVQHARPGHCSGVNLRAVERVDDDGAKLLLRALKTLDDAGREYHLEGAQELVALLGQQLEPMVCRHEALWLLQLELYAGLGQQEAFEEAAINYAVTFEVSPPSWEVHAKPGNEPAANAAPMLPGDGLPALRGSLVAVNAALAAALAAVNSGELLIDCTALQRIEPAAADALHAIIAGRHQTGVAVVLKNMPPLPYLFLSSHSWADCARLQLRKF